MTKLKKRTPATRDTAALDTNKLPTVEVGDIVLWAPDPGAKAVPAMCVAVGSISNRSKIDVSVMHPQTMTLDVRSGVPHRDDPRNKIVPDEEVGVWEIGPMLYRFEQMEGWMEDLKLSLAGAPAKMEMVKVE